MAVRRLKVIDGGKAARKPPTTKRKKKPAPKMGSVDPRPNATGRTFEIKYVDLTSEYAVEELIRVRVDRGDITFAACFVGAEKLMIEGMVSVREGKKWSTPTWGLIPMDTSVRYVREIVDDSAPTPLKPPPKQETDKP